jgi:uncharacterized membrane protein
MFRALFKLVFFAGEKVASETALLVSLLTLSEQGSHDARFWGALELVWKIIEGFFAAILNKTDFIQLMNSFADAAREAISKAGVTIEKDPQTALATLVGTFITMKILAFALGLFRRKILKKHRHDDSQNKPNKKTYENLYQGESDRSYTTK